MQFREAGASLHAWSRRSTERLNMNLSYKLNVESVNGSQPMQVVLPFLHPTQECIDESLKIVSPLVRRRNSGRILQLQPIGETEEEVLADLRRLVSQA
jgi:hypothetical protein